MSTVEREHLVELELMREADRLLAFAERLDSVCEGRERRTPVLATVILTPFLLLLLASMIANQFPDRHWPIVLAWFVWAGYFSLAIFDNLRRLHRDRRALFAIVDMLRELEQAILSTASSELERSAFRIRLSRLGIGPSTEPKV